MTGPALRDVAACLTLGRVFEVECLAVRGARVRRAPFGRAAYRPWRHGSVAEAAEALVAAGLAPPGLLDPAEQAWRRWSPRLRCCACSRPEPEAALGGPDDDPEASCAGCGAARELFLESSPLPASVAELAAVASLGLAAWGRAEGVARAAFARPGGGVLAGGEGRMAGRGAVARRTGGVAGRRDGVARGVALRRLRRRPARRAVGSGRRLNARPGAAVPPAVDSADHARNALREADGYLAALEDLTGARPPGLDERIRRLCLEAESIRDDARRRYDDALNRDIASCERLRGR